MILAPSVGGSELVDGRLYVVAFASCTQPVSIEIVYVPAVVGAVHNVATPVEPVTGVIPVITVALLLEL